MNLGCNPHKRSKNWRCSMTKPEMMKLREQMMAEMKAADARLDTLVKKMNAVAGESQVNAMAEVVNELARQTRAMHDRMDMHQQMMGLLDEGPQR